MSYPIQCKNELQALYSLYRILLEEGKRNNSYCELLNCLLSIEFNKESWERFGDFKEKFIEIGGPIAQNGFNRAERVYTTPIDRRSKPSYLKRLIAFEDKPKYGNTGISTINQIERISEDLSKKPNLSNLAFTIFRPADLFDQFRPGYVPCLISGDVKYRESQLHLSVFFRTNDTFRLAYADLLFMRKLQIEILEKAKALANNKKIVNGQIGELNIFFSRVFFEKTIKIHSNKIQVRPIIEELANELEKNWL